MIGIYKITNLINNKCYIGQSIHIERRWKEHLAKTSHSIYLQYAFAKYGIENFSFEVIEECAVTELDEKEKYWIQYYNSFGDNGYNLTAGGGGTIKYNLAAIYEEYCKTNSIAQTAKNIGCHTNTARNVLREYGINLHEQSDAKPVEAIDPNTLKIVKQYPSIEQAAKDMGVSHGAIQDAVHQRHQSSCGLYWRYVGSNTVFKAKQNIKCWKTKVQQLDYNKEIIINEFESAADAAEALGKDRKNGGSQIIAVCNGRKKSAFGFRWRKIEGSPNLI